MSAVAVLARICKWLAIGAVCVAAVWALALWFVIWFGNYMTEGTLETRELQGNLLVALSDDAAVKKALLSECNSTKARSPKVSALIQSGRLAEVPSGTRMHMPDWGGKDPDVGTMTIAEGPLRGRQIWACRGQFTLLHAWP